MVIIQQLLEAGISSHQKRKEEKEGTDGNPTPNVLAELVLV